MGQQQQNTPDSPILAAFLIFDSTTGALAAGSWGGTVQIVTPDQQWSLAALFGISGPGVAGDTFAEVAFSSAEGAGFRSWTQVWAGGDVSLRIIDQAGALAVVPPNTRIVARLYRRNGAVG